MIDERRVFQIFDRLEELIGKIENEFPTYEFMERLDYLRSLLKNTYGSLSLSFSGESGVSKATLSESYKTVQREVPMYFIVIQMVSDHLKNGGELSFLEEAFLDQLKELRQEWFEEPVIKVAHQTRNLLAHVRPFIGDSLNFEENLATGKTTIHYSLSEKDWTRLLEYIRTRERGDPAALKYVDARLKYEIYNPEKKANEFKYSFGPILSDSFNATTNLLDIAQSLFEEHYKHPLEERNELITEVETLNKELDGMGLITPAF